MDKKLILPFSIAFLSLAFLVVSFLVFTSRGNPYLIRKKLRIGALLLTLTGVSIGCVTTTCYESTGPFPPTKNTLTIDQCTDSGYIAINLAQSDTLTGIISERTANIFSYGIFDTTNALLQAGDIAATDGVFDEETEEFTIIIDSTVIVPGIYMLNFYQFKKDSIPDYSAHFGYYPLKISNQ